MKVGSSRARTRANAAGWAVPDRVPAPEGIDARLRTGTGRTGQLQVMVDHDCPGAGRCLGCGWVSTTSRRDCPSRVIALCLLERRPLPAWLAHLAVEVPGARTKRPAVTEEARRAVEDGLPGLFKAPARKDPHGAGDHR